MMELSGLVVPEAVVAAEQLLARIDDCLAAGFARLGSQQRELLATLAPVLAGTPLGEPVAQAVSALAGGHVTEDALLALAAAREALQGARHDALVDAANTALGSPWRIDVEPRAEPADTPGELVRLLEGARHWLVEIAAAGLRQLTSSAIVPFAAVLDGLQQRAELGRLAGLLTGFAGELLDNAPTASLAEVPVRRWSDLWSRSLLAARRLPPRPLYEPFSGELHVLGADLRLHDHLASVQAYALAGDRLVRATVTSWKVDAVAGDEVWALLLAQAPELIGAIADRKTLAVKEMELASTGDLRWTGSAKPGKSFDPIELATAALERGLTIPSVLPYDRHPVQLALPVVFDARAPALPIATQRISALSGLTALASADRAFGLLRFDAGAWQLQPLIARAQVKGKPSYLGPQDSINAAKKIKKNASTLGVLQERASKLLRAS